MNRYRYTINGLAADGQTYETSNILEAEPGNFPDVVMQAMEDSFNQLTQGKAVYGKPGLGCRGPYKITRLEVKLEGN